MLLYVTAGKLICADNNPYWFAKGILVSQITFEEVPT
jgi:hypothetical protein